MTEVLMIVLIFALGAVFGLGIMACLEIVRGEE